MECVVSKQATIVMDGDELTRFRYVCGCVLEGNVRKF